MKSMNQWLDAYAASHQDPVNKVLHYICVPAIVISLIGLLAAIPAPAAVTSVSPHLHWGTAFLGLSMAYYLVLSPALAIGMFPVAIAIALIVAWMDTLPMPLVYSSLTIFVIAWIGQFIGHKVEGKRPSFFEDVQFLMIGPLWILAALYRRLGLAYSRI